MTLVYNAVDFEVANIPSRHELRTLVGPMLKP